MDQPALTRAPPERADAARNRRHLLATAREMLAEQGADKLTMDALAERAGLGKGTVFRRFGTRAGIFQALLDDDERDFQQQVLSGPPPLGPGAPPLDRLVAYGRARTGFLIGHREIARAALDGKELAPAGRQSPISRVHIRYLLQEMRLGAADLDVLALQLTAALDGPLLLYLSGAEDPPEISERLGRGWEDLVQRACRPRRSLESPTGILTGVKSDYAGVEQACSTAGNPDWTEATCPLPVNTSRAPSHGPGTRSKRTKAPAARRGPTTTASR